MVRHRTFACVWAHDMRLPPPLHPPPSPPPGGRPQAQAHEEEPALLVLLRALQWAQAELRGRMDVPYPVISDLVTAVPTLPSSPGAPLPSEAALSG